MKVARSETVVSGPSSATDRAGLGWAAVWAAAILVLSLMPAPDWPGARQHFFSSLWPSSRNGWLDVFANVLLYVPLGLALSARGASRSTATLVAAAISTTVECLQYAVPGRDPSARDIAANTIGAFVGSAAAGTRAGGALADAMRQLDRAMSLALRADRRMAGVLSLVWAAIVAVVLILSAVLLVPAPPGGDRYFVRGPLFDRTSDPIRIGKGDDESYFGGFIDEVRIYGRPQPPEAIRSDMLQPVAATGSPGADPIAAYGFEEGAGPIVHDQTGHGHDGRIRGASWTPRGRFGGALSFDGHASEVIVPAAPELELRDGMTLEAWVFPVGRPSRWPGIVGRDSYYLYSSSDTGPYIAAGGGLFGPGNVRVRLPEPLSEREWTHLATTYDGQTFRLYVNGQLTSSRHWWSAHQPTDVWTDDLALPFGRIVDQPSLRSILLRDFTLRADVTCGSMHAAAAPVFYVTAPGNRDVISLLAQGSDLLVRASTRAKRLGLTSPDVRISDVFSNCSPGRRIDVTLSGPLQHPRARVGGHETPAVGLGLVSGWAFLVHSELLPPWLQLTCSTAWLCLLCMPFGFWARGTLTSVVAAALIVAAFGLVPVWSRIEPLGAGQLVTVGAALLAGASARLLFAGRPSESS